jgi:Holliday junction DNA helicase RuvB
MEMTDDKALRPQNFDEFVGQAQAKRSLMVLARAAKQRGEAADHVLFAGPPGLGKTSLAAVVSKELNTRLVIVNAPSIRSKGDMARVLMNLQPRDVLFLDEIHSLKLEVEELLYPALEDGVLQIMTGSNDSAEAVNIPLPPFTCIAATTHPGKVSQPLRDRLGETIQLEFYTDDELEQIILRSAEKLDMICTRKAAQEIARRSRGTPRIANRLLRRTRDFAQVNGVAVIDEMVVSGACDMLGIDAVGLDSLSRRYLKALISRRVPIGLDALAALLGESADTLEGSIEPFLMRKGLIERTSKGRIATSAGMQHIA